MPMAQEREREREREWERAHTHTLTCRPERDSLFLCQGLKHLLRECLRNTQPSAQLRTDTRLLRSRICAWRKRDKDREYCDQMRRNSRHVCVTVTTQNMNGWCVVCL